MKTSKEVSEIIPALFKVNAEIKNPAATADNPFFKSKYTPLNDLIDHIKAVLNKNDLFIIQDANLIEGNIVVTTRVCHVSGQWIEGTVGVPSGVDAQKTGAAITYARRYALSAMFNVTSETDNDGNELTSKPSKERLDFEQVKEMISNMNVKEMSSYWKEILITHNPSEKQIEALKKIFGVRKKEINQDNSFDSQMNIGDMI